MKDQLDRLITEMLDRGLLFEEATKEFEKQFIMKCLERSGGNRTQTAKALGIHRNTLLKKLSSSNHSGPRKKAGPSKKRLTPSGPVPIISTLGSGVLTTPIRTETGDTWNRKEMPA